MREIETNFKMPNKSALSTKITPSKTLQNTVTKKAEEDREDKSPVAARDTVDKQQPAKTLRESISMQRTLGAERLSSQGRGVLSHGEINAVKDQKRASSHLRNLKSSADLAPKTSAAIRQNAAYKAGGNEAEVSPYNDTLEPVGDYTPR